MPSVTLSVPLGYRLDHGIMKSVTNQKRNGIQWTLWSQLDDLDFADDLALLSQPSADLHHPSVQVGLKLNKQKTKILKINAGSDAPVILEGEELGEVESFTYLGSVVDKQGGTDTDVARHDQHSIF